MRRNLFVTLVALAATLLLFAAVPLPPKPERYVTDRAGVLPDARESALEEKLRSFERRTSTQVIVYLDTNLPEGTTLEEMSAAAIREWGVGQKGKDNGAILFLFTGSHDLRIEVGYGLEGALTDARSKRILTDVMTPRLRAGDYAGATDQGVDAIFAAVRREPYRGTGRTVAEAPDSSVSLDDFLELWLMPLIIIGALVLLILKAIYDHIRGVPLDVTFGPSGRTSSRHWDSPSSSSRSSPSSSSHSSSSGGFRGGGGSGGGGGASGKW